MQSDCLINGSMEIHLDPMDRGFSYGDGVFRTLVVRDGVPQCWEQHYSKLKNDCHALRIECPDNALLLDDIRRLCADDAAVCVKIVITRGDSVRGYALPAVIKPNRVVLKSALPDYPAQYYDEGVHLHLCQLQLALQPRLAGIKHLNRLENVLARMEWTDERLADGLLLDAEGYVIECTMSNIFMRSEQVLVTPNLSRCGVAGVTRDRLIELGPRLGYAIEIAHFRLEDLLKADEVILCNSLFGAWQVRSLCETSWPAGILASQLCEYLNEKHASIN